MSEFFVYPEDMSDYEETTDTVITLTKEKTPKVEITSSYNRILNETKGLVKLQIKHNENTIIKEKC